MSTYAYTVELSPAAPERPPRRLTVTSHEPYVDYNGAVSFTYTHSWVDGETGQDQQRTDMFLKIAHGAWNFVLRADYAHAVGEEDAG